MRLLSQGTTRLGIAATLALAIGLPATALAFDWNGQPGSVLLKKVGYFKPQSGHPMASACAFDEASKRAAADPALASALARAFGAPVPQGLEQVKFSLPYQFTTFGDWQNEIFTNVALEGRASHEDAGAFLQGRYASWLNDPGLRSVYLDAKSSDGYSSTYYLHSEAIDGKTQDESFDALKKHVIDSLRASIENLRAADRNGESLPSLKNGFEGLTAADCNERCRGLESLGSVFHVIEDSSVSCSGGAPGALAAAGKPACISGDGHTVVDWTAAGRPQVVALGDDRSYQQRTDVHEGLDGLYTGCSVDAYVYTSASGDSFNFDPKLVNASLLAEVARAVGSRESADAAAQRIWSEVVAPRFASPENRRPLPAAGPSTASRVSKVITTVGTFLGKAPWRPLSNGLFRSLGRSFSWAERTLGRSGGWSDGEATAWGTTGGVNVARNADTRPAGRAGAPSSPSLHAGVPH